MKRRLQRYNACEGGKFAYYVKERVMGMKGEN